MKGILYGVGVGPGDPELLTAKAIRLLRECDAVAAPKSTDGRQTALDIASPYIGHDKSILLFDMPLDEGKTVVFLTLGDPTVYSTYWYVHKRVAARGYAAELVPGVPSFCAAAAAMGRALCEDGEMLHIIPATHGRAEEGLALSGSKVLMKTGKSVLEVRELLRQRGELGSAALIERVGMDGQRLIENLDELEQPSGYFSIILVKEQSE